MSNVTLRGSTGGSGTGIETQDEGVTVGTAQTTLNFVGAGVTASSVADVTTVTISGGGGGGGITVDEVLANLVLL